MRHVRSARLSTVLLGTALLAGCSQAPVPQDQFYRLEMAKPAAPSAVSRRGTIEVARFVADGVTARRAIVFSQSDRPNQLQPHHYHFWTEPPPILLQNQLVTYLRAAKSAERVVTPALRVEPEFIVAGSIRQFEQVRGNPGGVVVELELSLKERRTERLLHHETYRVEAPTTNPSPPAAAAALSRSISEIFSQFAADIRPR